jgi:hypothetical protein
LFSFVVLSCLFPAEALSGVVVHDLVGVRDRKLMLRAETRGRFFARGGQLVEFFVDGKSIGKNLSGGDGRAFRPFVPKRTGIHQIRVTLNRGEGSGRLLSLDPGAALVLVDVEGTLFGTPFPLKPREGSEEAMRSICERFPVVLLQTSVAGLRVVKKWLEATALAASPVLAWKQGALLDDIAEMGLKIKAVVASPKVIEAWKGHRPLTFSFEKIEGTERVKDWEEISRKLEVEKN